MPGTSGFHGDDGNAEAGLPDDQSVSIRALVNKVVLKEPVILPPRIGTETSH